MLTIQILIDAIEKAKLSIVTEEAYNGWPDKHANVIDADLLISELKQVMEREEKEKNKWRVNWERPPIQRVAEELKRLMDD